MAVYTFDLFADYFQFYLQDSSASPIGGDDWTGDAFDRMLAVSRGAFAVGTVRNVDVPVLLEVLQSEPELDLECWDHVTECSLVITSGVLVIAGCTDAFQDATRIEVAPGTYRARISGGGFATVEKHWESGEDKYRVQLWPSVECEPKVLKLRPPQAT